MKKLGLKSDDVRGFGEDSPNRTYSTWWPVREQTDLASVKLKGGSK